MVMRLNQLRFGFDSRETHAEADKDLAVRRDPP